MDMFIIIHKLNLIESIKNYHQKLDRTFIESNYKNRALWELEFMRKHLIKEYTEAKGNRMEDYIFEIKENWHTKKVNCHISSLQEAVRQMTACYGKDNFFFLKGEKIQK